MEQTGWLAAQNLMEASGLQASFSQPGHFFVHNDDGRPELFVINEKGANLGVVSIVPARNTDWEDITSVPVDDGHWIVIGDIGDNLSIRSYIMLYFIEEPRPDENGRYGGDQVVRHRLDLEFPDGARDCESLAYDPVNRQLLLLSKRDKPAHLYTVDLDIALSQGQAELEFAGTIYALRPPTASDQRIWRGKTDWISQPTGLDISPDGSEAVIISYRSVYRYLRRDNEDWVVSMSRKPTELVGPRAVQNEAIAFSADGQSIFVTTEKLPAPIFRIEFTGDEG